ncbi:MAG: apolipoprotein N-acyltransferase [Lentisphaeria bacterium]
MFPSLRPTTSSPTSPGLRRLVSPWTFLRDALLAAASGLGIALAFPPVEQPWLAWFALLPLLLVPVPAPFGRRLLLGLLFGFALFVPNLWWLNTIGFAAGFLLALYCLLYPAAWYLLAGAAVRRLAHRCGVRTPAGAVGAVRLADLPSGAQCLLTLLLPAAWVAQEWIRGWLFTGFSWNQLGISQWAQPNLLPLATVTGVYGLSFLIVAVNVALAAALPGLLRRRRCCSLAGTGQVAGAESATGHGKRSGIAWPLPLAVALFLPVLALRWGQKPLPPPDGTLRVLAVQGCMELCREWTAEQLERSLAIYTGLSREGGRQAPRPDLVVWPETAVPAAARFERRYGEALRALFAELGVPLLVGTIDYRPELAPGDPEPPMYNSALLFDGGGRLVQFYDKVHRVPFGEFTPFGRQLPWLVEWIGMGRDLAPGREFTLFRLPRGVRAGTMICYEDAFPHLAREFVRRGAGLLVTLTNDAWYAESAGARQHLLHAVFRAVEQRRPLLRSGNNSDTALVGPDGRVSGLLRDPASGNPFYRGGRLYAVPVWRNLPRTWYSLHGDVFAGGCAGLTVAAGAGLLVAALRERARRLDMAETAAPPPPLEN